MENHQLINSNSSDVEYFTPPEIIEASRATMGRIELDPASSEVANLRVKADAWFGIGDRSLERGWTSHSLFMNHPFGRAEKPCEQNCIKKHVHHDYELYGNAIWINKLEREYIMGSVKEAICVTFACTSEKWFQPLLKRPQCFLAPRTNYYLPDGSIKKGVTKGSVITFFGKNVDKFAESFESLGVIKVPYCR